MESLIHKTKDTHLYNRDKKSIESLFQTTKLTHLYNRKIASNIFVGEGIAYKRARNHGFKQQKQLIHVCIKETSENDLL